MKRDRRGFALLAVLWLLVALAGVGAVSLATVRLGADTTRNRILLARAGWAREACGEILLARYAEHPSERVLDTVDLGRGTWCTAELEDPSAKLNVNLADPATLQSAVTSVIRREIAGSVVAWVNRRRPLADIGELAEVPGIDSATLARLEQLLTTRGNGVVNLNAAPIEVLAAMPGLTSEAIQVILGRRMAGRPLTSTDDLAASISPPARSVLYADYQNLLRTTAFAPSQMVARVSGGVRGTALLARATLTLVPLADRLAVIRREEE